MSNVNSSNKFESIKIITWEKAQTQKAYTQSHKLSVTHNVFGALNHDQRTLLILHPLCYIWLLCILLHPGSTVHFQLASRLTTDRGRPSHAYLMHVQYRYLCCSVTASRPTCRTGADIWRRTAVCGNPPWSATRRLCSPCIQHYSSCIGKDLCLSVWVTLLPLYIKFRNSCSIIRLVYITRSQSVKTKAKIH